MHSLLNRVELIQRLILLTLLGGFFTLLVEIRFEHSVVMGEKWQPWIPIVYLITMLVLLPLGMLFFRRFGRALLSALFIGLVVVGTLGFWFHCKNKPIEAVRHVIATDFEQPGHIKISNDDEETNPPVFAPLSLAGLGLIGLLVSLMPMSSQVNNKES